MRHVLSTVLRNCTALRMHVAVKMKMEKDEILLESCFVQSCSVQRRASLVELETRRGCIVFIYVTDWSDIFAPFYAIHSVFSASFLCFSPRLGVPGLALEFANTFSYNGNHETGPKCKS